LRVVGGGGSIGAERDTRGDFYARMDWLRERRGNVQTAQEDPKPRLGHQVTDIV